MRSRCGAGLLLIKAAFDARRHRTQPSPGGKHRIRRCALPRYPAYCLDTCPALCRSMCYPLRRSPLWTNFPPPLRRRPAFSKRGLRGSSDALKAKYLLVPVMMEAAAAQRFTLSATLSSSPGRACKDLARAVHLRVVCEGLTDSGVTHPRTPPTRCAFVGLAKHQLADVEAATRGEVL